MVNAMGRAMLRMGTKISGAGSLISFNKIGQPVWTDRNYAAMSDKAFKCVTAYACVRLVAKSLAKIPLCLYQGDDELEGDAMRAHPLWQLLHKPNPWQAGAAFFEGVAAYYQLNGNAPMEGVVGDFNPAPMGLGRPPDQLFCQRPDRMKIVASPYGTPMGYVYQVSNQKPKTWDADPLTGESSIMWWKTFHPTNDWYGYAPLEAGMYAVDQNNEASAHNKALLQNSGTPSGALVYSPKGNENAVLTEQQFNRLKEQRDDHIAGSRNAGKIMVLDGGFQWVAMGMSPKEMDWLEGKNVTGKEICQATGVPPFIFGFADTTFNNYGEARQALYESTVLPMLDDLLDFLNLRLTPCYNEPDLRIGYDEADISALEPKRTAKWMAIAQSNWLTTNEKRVATNYDELDMEEADAVLIPSTLTPLEGVLDQPDPAADPALGGDPNQPPAQNDADAAKKARADRRAAERLVRAEMKRDRNNKENK